MGIWVRGKGSGVKRIQLKKGNRRKGNGWWKKKVVKFFSMTERETGNLKRRAMERGMNESAYLWLLLFQKPKNYSEIAFSIIGRFAEEYLGKNYEAVYAVHDKGYRVWNNNDCRNSGKHLAVEPMGMKRFRQCKSFGEDYTEEWIRERDWGWLIQFFFRGTQIF